MKTGTNWYPNRLYWSVGSFNELTGRYNFFRSGAAFIPDRKQPNNAQGVVHEPAESSHSTR